MQLALALQSGKDAISKTTEISCQAVLTSMHLVSKTPTAINWKDLHTQDLCCDQNSLRWICGFNSRWCLEFKNNLLSLWGIGPQVALWQMFYKDACSKKQTALAPKGSTCLISRRLRGSTPRMPLNASCLLKDTYSNKVAYGLRLGACFRGKSFAELTSPHATKRCLANLRRRKHRCFEKLVRSRLCALKSLRRCGFIALKDTCSNHLTFILKATINYD